MTYRDFLPAQAACDLLAALPEEEEMYDREEKNLLRHGEV